MLITLTTPIPKGKHINSTIEELGKSCKGLDYIYYMINNWSDEFGEDVKVKYGWGAYCAKTGFGSSPGITVDDGWDTFRIASKYQQ